MPKKRLRGTSHTQDNSINADNDNTQPRRQKVIGGDLSGISKRTKRDFISRYFRANIINTIAILLIVLIAIAFFWPQKNNLIKEVTETVKPVESKSFYNQSRLDEPQATPSEQGFSRNTDIDRAEQYRLQDALELKIRNLLTQAEKYAANDAYTDPAGENAFETYQAVLKLDQRNVAARRAIEYMRGRFLETGYSALKKANLKLANSTLSKIAVMDSNSSEHKDLKNAIERYQTRVKTIALIRRAEKAFEEDKLLLPARANALYFYQQVLLIDEQNEDAILGVQKIADVYISKATQQVSLGNYQEAIAHLATVTVIDPEHPQLGRMQNVIKTAKQINAKLRVSDAAKTGPQTGAETDPQQTSTTRTPEKEASEQAAFDIEYLKQGLQAYSNKRYADAIALLQPLADKGIARAQYKIGYMTYYGQGTTRNRSAAIAIIRKALPAITSFADEGRTWAQVDLGALYDNGIVLPRDLSESIFWYRSAADKGFPEAQSKMGNAYRRGRGVAANRRTAIEWFQRAAKQGDQEAVRNLKQMGISTQ